jgi:hypothetical protein
MHIFRRERLEELQQKIQRAFGAVATAVVTSATQTALWGKSTQSVKQ